MQIVINVTRHPLAFYVRAMRCRFTVLECGMDNSPLKTDLIGVKREIVGLCVPAFLPFGSGLRRTVDSIASTDFVLCKREFTL